jgi:hypothetical protein
MTLVMDEMLVVDGLGAFFIAAFTLCKDFKNLHLAVKVSLATLMIGLLGQFVRDAQCLAGSCVAVNTWPPVWALTDLGSMLLVAYIFFSYITNRGRGAFTKTEDKSEV